MQEIGPHMGAAIITLVMVSVVDSMYMYVIALRFWDSWRSLRASFGQRGYQNCGIDCSYWQRSLQLWITWKLLIHMIQQVILVFPLCCHSSLDCMVRSGTTFINVKMEVARRWYRTAVNLHFEVTFK
jgi:hypothetical protein